MAEGSPPSSWPGHEVGGVDCPPPHPLRGAGELSSRGLAEEVTSPPAHPGSLHTTAGVVVLGFHLPIPAPGS